MADALKSVCEALVSEQQYRRTKCVESLSRYEMRRVQGLHPGAYKDAGAWTGDNYDELTWAYERSIANSAQAKIAGEQKPKVQFVTSDADWSTKRKSKKLDRFVEGQMMAPNGCYSDVWALMIRVFLDACVFPTGGVAKISSDADTGRINYERVFSWELYVDPLEARYGQPRNLFHVYPYDRDELIALFPEHADALELVNPYEDHDHAAVRGAGRVANQVKVYEAWRLPFSKSKPGRHVIMVDGTVLLDEEYVRDEFPFVWIRWSQHLLGFDGVSLVEEIASISDSINEHIQRMSQTVKHTSMGVCIYEEGDVREEDLRTNEDFINIRTKPGAANPPQWISPTPFWAANIQWVQMQVEKIHDISGVSEMTSTAQKPQGLTAGVAIRTVENAQSKRFSVIYRSYEEAFVALARHTVACARELAEQDPDFSVRWPGKSFLQTLKWSDVDLRDDQYVIQLYPVSGIKNTPADRLQLAQELNAAGKLSDEALIEVIKYLDTQKELDGVTKQRELIESYVESWLDYTPEKEASGEFRYEAPIPWMPSLPDALVQVAQAFLDASMNRIPEANKEFFLRYMQELDQQIEAKAQRAAALQATAAGQAPPQGSLNAA